MAGPETRRAIERALGMLTTGLLVVVVVVVFLCVFLWCAGFFERIELIAMCLLIVGRKTVKHDRGGDQVRSASVWYQPW